MNMLNTHNPPSPLSADPIDYEDTGTYIWTDPRQSVESPDSQTAARAYRRMLDSGYHSGQVLADVYYYFQEFRIADELYTSHLLRDKMEFEAEHPPSYDPMDIVNHGVPKFDPAIHLSPETVRLYEILRAQRSLVLGQAVARTDGKADET